MTTTAEELRRFRQPWRLRDGTPVVIRAVRDDDRARIVKAFHELDPESVYTRLFSFRKELTQADLDRLAGVDFVDAVVLVVAKEGSAGSDEVLIGGVSYYARTLEDGSRSAEIAFTIEEDYQGQGLAGKLLELAAALARSQGIARFEAEVLPVNAAMLGVFRHSGLPVTESLREDVIHVEMDLATVPPAPQPDA
ncbi:MAG: GNAT family N-acetyltransferase [Ideonella sp.]|nr:GNAT family N-acetyltransferase [Ideonella sp.]